MGSTGREKARRLRATGKHNPANTFKTGQDPIDKDLVQAKTSTLCSQLTTFWIMIYCCWSDLQEKHKVSCAFDTGVQDTDDSPM